MTKATQSSTTVRPIVDSHVHFWNPVKKNLQYSWIESVPPLNKPFELCDYTDQTATTIGGKISNGKPSISTTTSTTTTTPSDHRFMYVETDCDTSKSKPLAEIEYVTQMCSSNKRKHGQPELAGIVAYAPLEDGPKVVEPILETLVSTTSLVKGVRRVLQFEIDNPTFMLQQPFVESVRLLSKYNLVFDICVTHVQLPQVYELIESCPDTQFVLDHMGKPDIQSSSTSSSQQQWRDNMLKLSKLPNLVGVKISGVITQANLHNWTRDDIEPSIRYTVKTFGPNRIMFGSDWPVVHLAGTYTQWRTVLEEILNGASKSKSSSSSNSSIDGQPLLQNDDEFDKFYRSNAERIYKL